MVPRILGLLFRGVSPVNGAGPFAPIPWETIVRLLRYRVHVFCDNARATDGLPTRDTTSLTRRLAISLMVARVRAMLRYLTDPAT